VRVDRLAPALLGLGELLLNLVAPSTHRDRSYEPRAQSARRRARES
jgi:hypothetical protein